MTLSNFKTLVVEVLIILAHWEKAAKQMVTKIHEKYYQRYFEETEEPKEVK